MIATKDRVVRRTLEIGVGDKIQGNPGAVDHPLSELTDGPIDTGAHVVDGSRTTVFGDEAVRPGDIADVGEVTTRAEVADHDRPMAIALGGRNAHGQARGHEVCALPGSNVVERTHADHVLAASQMGGNGHGIGGHLAGRIRVRGAQRVGFVNREVIGRDEAVDLGARDGQDPVDAGVPGSVQHVLCSFDVGSQGAHRVGPGSRHVGLACKVKDDLRLQRLHVGEDRIPVGDVGSADGAIAHQDLVATGPQMLLQHLADEAGSARDQTSHDNAALIDPNAAWGCWSRVLTTR